MPGFGRLGDPGKKLIIGAVVTILLIAAWVAFARLSAKVDDRYEFFYTSLAEANKDGAITRGWIPDDILPRSSHNIHDIHDLSPSRQWCAFEFASDDSGKLRKKLKGIDVLPTSVRRVRDQEVPWWPITLKGDLDVQEIHKRGFDLYLIERPANSVQTEILLFAVDWSKGRAFFYSSYK